MRDNRTPPGVLIPDIDKKCTAREGVLRARARPSEFASVLVVERCLASSAVRLSRTMKDKCEADFERLAT